MYKLLIADDENTISEGLCSLVNWAALGYKVVHTVEDGEEAVEYLNRHTVDVILTDVKMTFMSGLELAKYVSENKPQIKVVILSGYKEFEFARQAVNYNVRHYLLKPTKLDELKDVFLKIKAELDLEHMEKEQVQSERQQHQELLMLTQEQFFTDLIMGALSNRTEINQRLKKIELGLEPATCKICIVNITMLGGLGYITDQQERENESLYTTLRHLMTGRENEIQYITCYVSSGNFKLLAVTDSPMEASELIGKVKTYIEQNANKIKMLLGIDTQSEIERIFDSMYETAIHFQPIAIPQENETNRTEQVISKMDFLHLERQKVLLLSYIRSGKKELANNLFENIINEMSLLDKKVVAYLIISIFEIIRNEISAVGPVMKAEVFDYETVSLAKNIEDVREWGLKILVMINCHVDKNKMLTEKKVIQKAKEYIKANYASDIGLEEVAEAVYLSSIYFSRLFKKQTNENFVNYLVKVRMQKAKELLRDSRLKVYEISEKVGYRNTKYFYKLFKEYTGLTPAEYRENIEKSGELYAE